MRAEGLEGVQWLIRCGGHSGYERGMSWLKGRLIATLLSGLASMSIYALLKGVGIRGPSLPDGLPADQIPVGWQQPGSL